MTSPLLYIFSKSEEMRKSLTRFVRFVCLDDGEIRHEFIPTQHSALFSKIEDITSMLDEIPQSKLLNTAVILDLTNGSDNSWNVISSNKNTTDIAATLSLLYPEVYWIFIGMENNIPSSDLRWFDEHFVNPLDRIFDENGQAKNGMEKCIDLFTLHQYGFCPLFDPSGLRVWVKKNIEKEQEKPVNDLEKGKDLQLAAAIDEETSYAFLHGYLAYKLGYRSYAVTTLSMMKELFEDKGKTFDLVFEDIFTSFPDKDPDFHLSDIEKKDDKFKGFKDVQKRIFVTVGHKHIDWYESNEEYKSALKKEGKHVKTIYKPSGGLYNLLDKCRLNKEYFAYQRDRWKSNYEDETNSHSAHGRLLEIANFLIDRAERIYHNHNAQTVKDCIYGAVLANEAKELIDYKTPTTCLEAIALRHKLEVKAECMFYGVEYNIDVKNRLKELRGEIKAVSRYFHKSIKEKSSLNAQMMIVTEIMKIFREHGQFDEEQGCMKYFRTLNRRWYFKKHPYFIFFKPFRFYFDTLIGNFRYFLIAILILPLFFGVMSNALGADFVRVWELPSHIVNAYFTFYGLQPVKFPENPSAKVITVILVFAGFSHLGIFIAFLFTILSRRN